MEIQEALGLEAIVVCDSLDETIDNIFIERASNWDVITAHMKTRSIDFDSNTRVFHGILTRADVLPENGYKNAIVAVCVNPADRKEVFCSSLEVESVEDLAHTIETLIVSSSCLHFGEDVSIHDVYILYGYEKPTFIMADEISNEEVLIKCRQTYSAIIKGG